MHYSRFKDSILTEAVSDNIITCSERGKIDEFWYENIIYNISEHVDFLKGLGLKMHELSVEKYEIITWPYIKIQNLLVCQRNPRKWKYEDEEGNFLFGYTILENENIFSLSDD